MYNFLRSIRSNFITAKRVDYNNWKDKFEIFRVLNRLSFKMMFGNKKNITQRIFNYKVHAPDANTLERLFTEIFVHKEYPFITDKTKPLIFDVGANIGMSILYFKMIYPQAKILAFEPNPSVFELLKKNVEENNLSDVTLFNIGLSNREGISEFFFDDNIGILSGSLLADRGGKTTTKIKLEKLSTYLIDSKADLIKIDVEGAEFQILEDLLETKTIQNTENYLIEYHHKVNNNKSIFSTFLSPFEANGFEYNMKTDYYKKGHFQDAFLWLYK